MLGGKRVKIIHLKKRWFVGAALLFCLAAYVLVTLIGSIFNFKYISVITAVREANDFEVRSRLLMEAMDRVGACTPEEAADIWASGLKERSAALQYAVMDEALKAEYAAQLKKSAPNWVTGLSSPWVESYEVTASESPTEDSRVITLSFLTATSTGPGEKYEAVLYLLREGNFWRIVKIQAEEGLYPYTLFNPPEKK